MIRRCVIIALSIVMLFTCLVPAFASGLTKAERYDAAVTELRHYLNDEGSMSLDDLFMSFTLLGSYEHSAMLAVYTNALRNVEKGEYDRVFYYIRSLQVDEKFCAYLEKDDAFGSIGMLEAYAHARQAEQDGDINKALERYQECSCFMDSFARMMALQDSQLADKYQQALACFQKDTYEGYQQAYELCLELSSYGGYENSAELMAMADILRATPAPTPAPTPTPISAPVPTVAATGVEYSFYPYWPDAYNQSMLVIAWDDEGLDWSFSWRDITENGELLTFSEDSPYPKLINRKREVWLRNYPAGHTWEFFIYPKGESYDGLTSYRFEYTFPAIEVSRISQTEVDEFTIAVYSDNTCAITNYTGNQSFVSIPSVLNGFAVIGIGNDAFNNCDSLASISIPDGVTVIGMYAFAHCDSLTNISIPNSVKFIGYDAFSHCNSLSSIYIPSSVRFVEDHPFTNCHNLTDIIVSPDHPDLAVIDGVLFNKSEKKLICYPMAFKNQSYSIPNDTKIIGERAFYACDSLTSISIPNSVKFIGFMAFSHCNSLSSITLPDSVTTIEPFAFSDCDNLISVSLPNNDTWIGYDAFGYCDSLISVFIPNGIISMKGNPFSSCPKLTNIMVSNDHPTVAVIDGVIFDKVEQKLICYPSALRGQSYSIPVGTWIIGHHAFDGCNTLITVSIPDSVVKIEPHAFMNCDALTSVSIPDSVTTIDHAAFGWCDSLTNVTLPQSVIYINPNAFLDSPNVTLRVPANSYAQQFAIDSNIPYTVY